MKIQSANYSSYSANKFAQTNMSQKGNQNVQFKGVVSKTMTAAGSLAGFGVATTALNVAPVNVVMAVMGVLTILAGCIMGHNWGVTLEDKLRKKLVELSGTKY